MIRRRWTAVVLAALLVVLGLMIRPQVQFMFLAPQIQDGIVEGFETFGPGSERPSDDWWVARRGYTLFAGWQEDRQALAEADIGFLIQESYDVQVAETYTATYAYSDGQWQPIRMERTTGWGNHLRTYEQPLGFWLLHLRVEE